MASNKKILEKVSGWLRVYDDNSVDRSWTGPPEVEFLMKSVPPHQEFKDDVATRDVLIDSTTGLAARIYIPAIENGFPEQNKMPLILHFHGGGFCISRADWYMYYHFYSRLVRSVRAVCVSVYLRLALEHRLPAACDDAYAAFLWLRGVARGESPEEWLQKYADFGRVFLVGDSSGGNIVHDLAARAGRMESEPVRLAGGVAIHPGFLRAEPSKSFLELAESPLLTRDMVNKFMGLALPIGSSKDHPITCPMGSQAPPLSGLNLPPMLVMVAEKDLLRDTELEYCDAMKKEGKEVEVMMNAGMGHSFYFNKLAMDSDLETAAQVELLVQGIKSFITRHGNL